MCPSIMHEAGEREKERETGKMRDRETRREIQTETARDREKQRIIEFSAENCGLKLCDSDRISDTGTPQEKDHRNLDREDERDYSDIALPRTRNAQ